MECLDDSTDIWEALERMSVYFDVERIAKYTKLYRSIVESTGDYQFAPNHNQFAAAVASLYIKDQRVLLSVPPGKGKSRILAVILIIKFTLSPLMKFTIVFASEFGKSVDCKKYQQVADFYQINLNMVVFQPGVPIENQVREYDFVLMDEADEILLDNTDDSRGLKNK